MSNATTLPEFNPSNNSDVSEIKALTENLIIKIRDMPGDSRCKSLAITNYEQAAMWAVKSLFVK